MRISGDQARLVRKGQARLLLQRRHVAVHGKDALSQDEFRASMALMLTQKLAEMGGIAMPVANLANACGLAAEMHARVVEAVGEDERLRAEHGPIEQSGKDRGIG